MEELKKFDDDINEINKLLKFLKDDICEKLKHDNRFEEIDGVMYVKGTTTRSQQIKARYKIIKNEYLNYLKKDINDFVKRLLIYYPNQNIKRKLLKDIYTLNFLKISCIALLIRKSQIIYRMKFLNI
jgi:hypothetical protein